MKKPLAVVIIGIVVSFAAMILVSRLVEHTWGPEQCDRVSQFVIAGQFLLVPLAFYPAYHAHKPMSPARARNLKRFYILVSISFLIVGMACGVRGLGDISVLPIDLAYDIARGIFLLVALPWIGVGILLLRDPDLFKLEPELMDRPGA